MDNQLKNIIRSNYYMMIAFVLWCILDTVKIFTAVSPVNVTGATIHTETTKIYDSTAKSIAVASAPGTVSFYPVAIPANMDTAAIGAAIRNYFASYTYTQVVQDSSIRATIFDSLSQNRIMGRRFAYQWLKPVETIKSTTVTLPPPAPKIGFYVGAFVEYDLQRFGFGPRLSVETKKNLVIGYDFEALNKRHRIGLSQKIKW